MTESQPEKKALAPGDRPTSRCSFCQQKQSEVGSLAEGPNHVYICYPCIRLCADIIENECRRLGISVKQTHDG